jgi:hypothetical protein
VKAIYKLLERMLFRILLILPIVHAVGERQFIFLWRGKLDRDFLREFGLDCCCSLSFDLLLRSDRCCGHAFIR